MVVPTHTHHALVWQIELPKMFQYNLSIISGMLPQVEQRLIAVVRLWQGLLMNYAHGDQIVSHGPLSTQVNQTHQNTTTIRLDGPL